MRPTPRADRPTTAIERTPSVPLPGVRRPGSLVGLAGAGGLLLVVLILAIPFPTAVAGAAGVSTAHPPLAPAAWTKLAPATSPPTRQSGTMVFDPVAKEFVLFGGDSNGALGDTWTYAAGVWTNRTSTILSQPSARWYFGMTWDAADGVVLLFGGRNLATDFGDTWEFNGTAWSRVATTVAPPPMTTSRLTYDARDGLVVLYGGDSILAGTPSFYNVVWTFRLGAWTNITSHVTGLPANPNELTDGVYDAATGAILYFGGNVGTTGGCNAPGYTWTYSGRAFTNISRARGTAPPLALGSRMMTYDPAIQGVVLYGGWDGGSCAFAHATYEYASGTWTQVLLARSPGPLWDGDMATDTATGNVVLFSGATVPYSPAQSSQTWRFTP